MNHIMPKESNGLLLHINNYMTSAGKLTLIHIYSIFFLFFLLFFCDFIVLSNSWGKSKPVQIYYRMLRGDAVQAEPGIHCQFFLDHNYCSGEYLTTNTGKEYMTAHLAKFTFVLMHFLLDNVFSQWPFKSYQGVMQYEI